jgi:hypothetical protein
MFRRHGCPRMEDEQPVKESYFARKAWECNLPNGCHSFGLRAPIFSTALTRTALSCTPHDDFLEQRIRLAIFLGLEVLGITFLVCSACSMPGGLISTSGRVGMRPRRVSSFWPSGHDSRSGCGRSSGCPSRGWTPPDVGILPEPSLRAASSRAESTQDCGRLRKARAGCKRGRERNKPSEQAHGRLPWCFRKLGAVFAAAERLHRRPFKAISGPLAPFV